MSSNHVKKNKFKALKCLKVSKKHRQCFNLKLLGTPLTLDFSKQYGFIWFINGTECLILFDKNFNSRRTTIKYIYENVNKKFSRNRYINAFSLAVNRLGGIKPLSFGTKKWNNLKIAATSLFFGLKVTKIYIQIILSFSVYVQCLVL